MTSRLWFVRVGPCWCSGVPRGATRSFDLHRLRSTPLPGTHRRDVVVAPLEVPESAWNVLDSVVRRGATVVGYRPCPGSAAVEAGLVSLLAAGSVPDRWIDECVTGHPDLLAVELAEHWAPILEPLAV